jgi:alkanesulfonate monooxygenase SsuD/methylene tetrahydromethanopterin reductase-like flavin-dependent oxidoreductase (luciferase family)
VSSATRFRFAVVAGSVRASGEWFDLARATEAAGYDVLLQPDTRFTPAPFAALAAAGAVTRTLRLGTWVLAAPLHIPAAVAREAATLQLLTDGRFELGLGTGRPAAAAEAELLGLPWGTGAERIRRVFDVIDAVRSAVLPAPRILVAGSGPTILAAAGRVADTVALALPPTATVDDVARAADTARSGGDPELALQLSGVGGRLVLHLARQGLTTEALADTAGVVDGDGAAMADRILELRRRTGVSTIAVAAELAAAFAPVLPLLREREAERQ